MKRIALFICIAILCAAAGVYFGSARHTPSKPEDKALASLFSQELAPAHGTTQPLSQWKGKPLLINFWATWCGPCVEEMPALNALQKEIGRVQIIGIGIDSQKNIEEFAEKLHITYPLYVAGSGATEVLRQLGDASGGLPFTVLIGADGKIAHSYLGGIKFDQLRADLASINSPK